MTTGPLRRPPLVSAIMAAYNAEEWIAETLASVLAQDWHPFEVIVVDDGSDDRTGELIRSFPAVRCIQQANAGPSAARNAALELANGEFVAIFDADDLFPPERLRTQVAYLLGHPDVGGVLGRQEWLNPPDWLTRDAVYGDLAGIPVGGSAMFRTSVLREVGGYDTALQRGEDTDLLIRLREQGIDYVVLPDVVLYRRYRPTSLTGGRNFFNPLLRSLHAKLERERSEQGAS
jgi:glycosyltransferase involved in cell wall biosynthesis